VSAVVEAATRLRAARDRARDWLLGQVGADGKPADCELGNGWSRFPWTFALLGETAAGHAVLEWASRNGLGDNGDFSAGPSYGAGRFSAYPLGHLAMGAVLLERHDVAARLIARLESLQNPTNGGMPIDPPGGTYAEWTDLLSSAQAGMVALLAGRMDMARPIRDWIVTSLEEQPDWPRMHYTARSPGGLVTEPPAELAWVMAVNFARPRQAYFYPGIGAAFLALYAMRTGDRAALAAGHQYLEANLQGHQAQFDDLESVQACKFAWGAALMQIADPEVDYSETLVRMADWFIARQGGDGSWAPSRFISPQPTRVEQMTKTAEHAMEVTALLAAMAVVTSR
jgi:hypothetical protein